MTPDQLMAKACPILESRSHNRKGGAKLQTCMGPQCVLWTETTTTKSAKVDGQNGVMTTGAVYCGLGSKP